MALLRRAGATFLKLDVTDRTDHRFLPSGTHIASLEQVADIVMTEAVDAILLRWNEQNFQHYSTVARVDTGTVWTAGPAVQHALRDLVQSS